FAQSSLGDIARQSRKAPIPKQKRIITNDDLQPARATAPEKAEPASNATPDSTTSAPDAAAPKPKKAEADAASMHSRTELLASWKGRITAKRHEIELLERESTVAEREAQMQEHDFYMDAGERLRTARAFAEKQEKAKAEIEAKRTSLEAAKQQLTDMMEQARKEGIPASQLE
ncbi:MAG TPA: hypothetical protein VGC88_07245, partial [Terriglobales bacterium]